MIKVNSVQGDIMDPDLYRAVWTPKFKLLLVVTIVVVIIAIYFIFPLEWNSMQHEFKEPEESVEVGEENDEVFRFEFKALDEIENVTLSFVVFDNDENHRAEKFFILGNLSKDDGTQIIPVLVPFEEDDDKPDWLYFKTIITFDDKIRWYNSTYKYNDPRFDEERYELVN